MQNGDPLMVQASGLRCVVVLYEMGESRALKGIPPFLMFWGCGVVYNEIAAHREISSYGLVRLLYIRRNNMHNNIVEIVNRETAAWDNKNTDLLLSIFHPDMVWVWPKDKNSHNPADWECPQGKFDAIRWKGIYDNLFGHFDLVHNNREIIKIVCTEEQDGGFAVVDIDTLWHDPKTGNAMHWLGRTCKTYVKTAAGIKMIAQTGVLNYASPISDC